MALIIDGKRYPIWYTSGQNWPGCVPIGMFYRQRQEALQEDFPQFKGMPLQQFTNELRDTLRSSLNAKAEWICK